MGVDEVRTKSFWGHKSGFVQFSKTPPLIDYEKPFCLQTDASEIGAGVILLQKGLTPV